jgi:hypothetical protein
LRKTMKNLIKIVGAYKILVGKAQRKIQVWMGV